MSEVTDRPRSPVNGQPVPNGKVFTTTDERARQAGKASGVARREKADLRRMAKVWLETEVGKNKDGQPITGAELMIGVAVKEIRKGNPRFWELLRDTAGFKPVDKIVMAEVEPSVVREVETAVQDAMEKIMGRDDQ